jgi:tetratricopeptide (TPR) repeat protein
MNLYVSGRLEEAHALFLIAYETTKTDSRINPDEYWRRRMDGLAGLSAAVIGVCEQLSGGLVRARRWVVIACGRMHRSRPRIAAYADEFLAAVEIDEGGFVEAERAARAGIRHAERVGHSVQLPSLEVFLGLAVFHQGRYDEALRIAQQGQRRADAAGDRTHATRNRSVVARSLVRLGRVDEAREALARTIRDAVAIRTVPWALDEALLGVAEEAVARGETELAVAVARCVTDLHVVHPLARHEATELLGRLAPDRHVPATPREEVVRRVLDALERGGQV